MDVWIVNRRMARAARRHPADLARLTWYEADHRCRLLWRAERRHR